jgi:hypothetical protein
MQTKTIATTSATLDAIYSARGIQLPISTLAAATALAALAIALELDLLIGKTITEEGVDTVLGLLAPLRNILEEPVGQPPGPRQFFTMSRWGRSVLIGRRITEVHRQSGNQSALISPGELLSCGRGNHAGLENDYRGQGTVDTGKSPPYITVMAATS